MSKVNKILMERCKDMYKTPSYTEGSINSRDGHCFFLDNDNELFIHIYDSIAVDNFSS